MLIRSFYFWFLFQSSQSTKEIDFFQEISKVDLISTEHLSLYWRLKQYEIQSYRLCHLFRDWFTFRNQDSRLLRIPSIRSFPCDWKLWCVWTFFLTIFLVTSENQNQETCHGRRIPLNHVLSSYLIDNLHNSFLLRRNRIAWWDLVVHIFTFRVNNSIICEANFRVEKFFAINLDKTKTWWNLPVRMQSNETVRILCVLWKLVWIKCTLLFR